MSLYRCPSSDVKSTLAERLKRLKGDSADADLIAENDPYEPRHNSGGYCTAHGAFIGVLCDQCLKSVEPTSEEKSRYIVEQMGSCWHAEITGRVDPTGMPICLCGFIPHITAAELRIHIERCNPNYSTDVIGLLEVMYSKAYWPDFLFKINGEVKGSMDDPMYTPLRYMIDIYYILTPGKLLDAAYQWLKEQA